MLIRIIHLTVLLGSELNGGKGGTILESRQMFDYKIGKVKMCRLSLTYRE